MSEEEFPYKLILLGNSGVGKTNLINKYNIILVYDITDKKSFQELEQLEYWIQLSQETEINCMFGIVGNKCDLYMEEQVTEEEARIFAKSKGYKFKLVSAKSNPNTLNEFLEELVQDYNELNNINNPNAKIIYLDEYYYDYEEERVVNLMWWNEKKKI